GICGRGAEAAGDLARRERGMMDMLVAAEIAVSHPPPFYSPPQPHLYSVLGWTAFSLALPFAAGIFYAVSWRVLLIWIVLISGAVSLWLAGNGISTATEGGYSLDQLSMWGMLGLG